MKERGILCEAEKGLGREHRERERERERGGGVRERGGF
jgi:hypothetical protein